MMMLNKKEKKSQSIVALPSPSETKPLPLPTLNDDVLVEILIRLPYKSLIRSTAVSKTWLDLIANPKRPNSCRSLYFKSNPSPLLGIFLKHHTGVEWKPIDQTTPRCHPSFEAWDLYIEASSNGFILYQHRSSYYVANPFTNQRVQLPQLLMPSRIYDFPVGFTCRADQSPANFTVSYVDSHGDQKCQHVKVFSTFANGAVAGWRDLCLQYKGGLKHCYNESRPPKLHYLFYPAPVLQEQVFYWIKEDHNLVVSCDLNEGSYWDMEVPSSSDAQMYEPTVILHVIQDHLYCGMQSITYNADIKVWVFEGDLFHYDRSGRWVLKYVVGLRDLESRLAYMVPRKEASNDPDIHGPKADLEALHPCNPWIVFFTLDSKLVSYNAESRCLVVHGKRPVDFVLCEWRPWPHSLPVLLTH